MKNGLARSRMAQRNNHLLFQIVAAVPAHPHRSVLPSRLQFGHGDEIVEAIGLRFDVDRVELEHDARPVRSDHARPMVQVVVVIRRVVERRDYPFDAGRGRVQIVTVREFCGTKFDA